MQRIVTVHIFYGINNSQQLHFMVRGILGYALQNNFFIASQYDGNPTSNEVLRVTASISIDRDRVNVINLKFVIYCFYEPNGFGFKP